jgi:hypothetical protein
VSRSASRPIQRAGVYAGKPYAKTQAAYAEDYKQTIRTVKRWWKRGLPCDDPDAMGEYISRAGRKADEPAPDFSDVNDRLAESAVNRLDEKFLEGEGLVAAIKRIGKIELALADAIRQELNKPSPNVRALLNRLAAWTAMLDAMRKLEKDTPGILEHHKKQIDIGEVEEGVTRLLLAVVNRLSMLPTRAMQTLAGFSDPQDIRDELEKEIADVLAPIRECEFVPPQFREKLSVVDLTAPPKTPTPMGAKKPRRRAKPSGS